MTCRACAYVGGWSVALSPSGWRIVASERADAVLCFGCASNEARRRNAAPVQAVLTETA